jgi:TM2 domain-containing membrane protein YozV
MKNLKYYSLFLCAFALVLTSCTIQKRHYRNGYYFNAFGSNILTEKQKIYPADSVYQPSGNSFSLSEPKSVYLDDSCLRSLQNDKLNPIAYNIANEVQLYVSNVGSLMATISSDSQCDILVLKNGEELEVKVLEVGVNFIKYKKCGSEEGPIFTINMEDALMVKYHDGTKTVFKSENTNSDPLMNMVSGDKGKSQLIALLLCLFFGTLGLHRFYLGYYEIGIIQILTLGGCGIWWLIDLIMILTGDLKPKKGDYGSKL